MLFITALFLATAAAPLNLICNPTDNDARILRSASPGDIHPDWSDGSVVGTGQGLKAHARTTDQFGITYLRGDLYSTRGGLLNRNVFVLQSEWRCWSRVGRR